VEPRHPCRGEECEHTRRNAKVALKRIFAVEQVEVRLAKIYCAVMERYLAVISQDPRMG